MQTISIIGYEEEYEVEGAFDAEGNILSWWSCNDASWRGEYFNDLFEKLGIKILQHGDMPAKTYKALQKKLHQATDQY